MQAHEIKAIAAQADETDELLVSYLQRVDQVRDFVRAFELAACEEITRDQDTKAKLYWPSLMEGLQRLFPDDGRLEVNVRQSMQALRAINEGSALRDTSASAPAAPLASVKRTTRASLATVATHQP